MQPLASPEPGRNLAPTAFTSPEIFELEQRQLFPKSWVHVADLADVAEPGSYVAAKIGRTPILLVRDRTGELRGFLNACRHRGAQLLEGKGTCDKQIKCPYHAWSYGLDGALHGVPYREQFEHCEHELDAMGLVPVRIGTAGPLIFACVDPTAPSFAEWIGDLAPAIAHTASWKLGYELTYDLAANWKLFVENANDGYHVQFVHDILTDVLSPEPPPVTILEPHGAFSWAHINPAYVPPDGDPAQARVRFGCIFPNLIPVLAPSDLTYMRVDPVAPDRLRLFVRSYDHPDFVEMREFRKFAFERTAEQDFAVVVRTQQGLHAHGLPAGVHASMFEARIGHFERTWSAAMFGEVAPKRHLAVLER